MDERPRYMISVAAELVGMHPQARQRALLDELKKAGA